MAPNKRGRPAAEKTSTPAPERRSTRSKVSDATQSTEEHEDPSETDSWSPEPSGVHGDYLGKPFGTGNSPGKSYVRRRLALRPKKNMGTKIYSVETIEWSYQGLGMYVYTEGLNLGYDFIEHHDIWKCQNGPEAVDEWFQSQESKVRKRLKKNKLGPFLTACENYTTNKILNTPCRRERQESEEKIRPVTSSMRKSAVKVSK
jgi:hypothetical protein